MKNEMLNNNNIEAATIENPKGKDSGKIRDAANYGGRIYRTATFTGEAVERFAAPVRFNLNNQDFSCAFEFWEDVSDFEAGRNSIDSLRREFSGKTADYQQFAELFEAIGSGALEFLEVAEKTFTMTNINIDALRFAVSVTARHQTRNGYSLSDNFADLELFQQLKDRYLDSIVMPFLAMAWTLAAADRNLSKFE